LYLAPLFFIPPETASEKVMPFTFINSITHLNNLEIALGNYNLLLLNQPINS
jgi:hypothetical protein